MCVLGTRKCNCDINKQVWHEDSGYITLTSEFPVKKLAFGDLGSANEEIKVQLGPMECEGNNIRNTEAAV